MDELKITFVFFKNSFNEDGRDYERIVAVLSNLSPQ